MAEFGVKKRSDTYDKPLEEGERERERGKKGRESLREIKVSKNRVDDKVFFNLYSTYGLLLTRYASVVSARSAENETTVSAAPVEEDGRQPVVAETKL